MSLAQQAARNRLALEQQAGLRHNEKFDRAYRRQNHSLLLVLAVLISACFFLSMDVIAMMDEGAKPGDILGKSELTKEQIKKLNVMPSKAEKRNVNK